MPSLLRSLWNRWQRYRLEQAQYRSLLRMDQRHLRDIGLVGPGDVHAIVDGTFFSDATRLPRPAYARAATDAAWRQRGRLGLPEAEWRRCA